MLERRARAVLSACVLATLIVTPAAAFPASSPQELFERAEALYRQLAVVDPSGEASSWTEVVTAFEEVAARHPESPLAPEAIWRVASIYSRQGERGDRSAEGNALAAYEKIVGWYPQSPHAPEALLRLAARAEGEEGTQAAALYSRLLQQYPTTTQAALARNRLANFGSERPLNAVQYAPVAADPEEVTTPPSVTRETAPSAGPSVELTPLSGDPARLEGIRHYSDASHTRVVLDLDRPVSYQLGEAQRPARLFLDLAGVKVIDSLPGASRKQREQVIRVSGDLVRQVRVGINRPGVARVVLDLQSETRYTLFTLDRPGQPFRIVLDVPTSKMASRLEDARRPTEAAERETLPVARQLQLGVQRIMIDPGHGGQDPGAIGRTGITEKNLTLELSKLLAEEFRASGFEVMLTRDDDRTVPLKDRTRFANQAGADLFVSVHVNSARNPKLRGFETYFLNLATDPTAAETAARENAGSDASLGDLEDVLEKIVRDEFREESSALAQSVQDSLVMTVSQNYDNVRDLGVKSAPFFVLVGAGMPSVLVEASFLSNPDEEKRLRDHGYRHQLVKAVHDGVLGYIESQRTARRE